MITSLKTHRQLSMAMRLKFGTDQVDLSLTSVPRDLGWFEPLYRNLDRVTLIRFFMHLFCNLTYILKAIDKVSGSYNSRRAWLSAYPTLNPIKHNVIR